MLTTQGLGTAQFILTLVVLGFILFRKAEIKNLRKELLWEMEKLRNDMDNKIDALHREVNDLRKDMETNITALRKAVLLIAQKYVDDPERLERIKDLLTI